MKSILSCALTLIVALAASGSLQAAAPPGGVDRARVKALVRKLDADNFFTRQRADQTLRAMGKTIVAVLREERDRSTSFEVRERLNRMLRDLAFDDQVPTLVRLLGHPNMQYRDQADRALRQAGASVIPLLKKELHSGLDAESRGRLEKIIAELSAGRR
jgi:hypothetical protein